MYLTVLRDATRVAPAGFANRIVPDELSDRRGSVPLFDVLGDRQLSFNVKNEQRASCVPSCPGTLFCCLTYTKHRRKDVCACTRFSALERMYWASLLEVRATLLRNSIGSSGEWTW